MPKVIGRKPSLTFFCVGLLAISLCLSLIGCAKMKDRDVMLPDLFEVKPAGDDVVQVAVLPIQNATFHPIRITGKQNFISRFLEDFLNKKLKFTYTDDDVRFVQNSLQSILTQRLYNAKYRVLDPGAVLAAFERQGILVSDSEMFLADITPQIPADWMLLVTITEWDGSSYDRRGKGKLSYRMTLVDTRLKQSIWDKEETGARFEAPLKYLTYNRQAGETLNVIAKRMLKGMPKPQSIMAYKEKLEAASSASQAN